MAFMKILCWVFIFILRLCFPPGGSIAGEVVDCISFTSLTISLLLNLYILLLSSCCQIHSQSYVSIVYIMKYLVLYKINRNIHVLYFGAVEDGVIWEYIKTFIYMKQNCRN